MYRLTEDETRRRELRFLQLRNEVWGYTAVNLEELLNDAREEYAGLELEWRHDHSDPKLEERRQIETAIKLWSDRLRAELDDWSRPDGRLEDLLLERDASVSPGASLRAAANGLALLLADREILED